jgi:hypothetical protein
MNVLVVCKYAALPDQPKTHALRGSVATFRFCRKTPRFRDFAEKPVVDFEALRQDGFRANPGFFGRIKSLQHFRDNRMN